MLDRALNKSYVVFSLKLLLIQIVFNLHLPKPEIVTIKLVDLYLTVFCHDDEVELTDEESSDNDDEIAKVFRIDTNIFDYETPLCSAVNEFNYLLKVDPDLLTKDIIGFKTYEDYKDD
ncbi:hypothetical protein Tco_0785335 [Tanacetum coccineum]